MELSTPDESVAFSALNQQIEFVGTRSSQFGPV